MAEDSNIVQSFKYKGTPQTVAKMFEVADEARGQKSFKLRARIENIIRGVRQKDYLSEYLAIYYWACGPQFRYTRDPRKVEQIKDPLQMIWEIDNLGSTLVDCDEFTTFLRAAIGTIGGRSRVVTVGFKLPDPKKIPRQGLTEDPVFRLMTSPHPRLPGPFTHVFAQVERPGSRGVWITVDPVAGQRTRKMHARVKQCRIYVSDDND